MISFILRRIYLKKNRSVNMVSDADPALSTKGRIVNDQNGKTGLAFRYGAHRARWNACEVIAVHNVKVITGDHTSTLTETAADFQKAGAMIGAGFFGSNPRKIGKVLSRSGIGYEKIPVSGLTVPGLYIVSFWTGKRWLSPLHTVTVKYDGDTYTVYNCYGSGEVRMRDNAVLTKKYICGYRVE